MNKQWPRLLCAGALALTSLLAHAQYSWLDDKGSRVFSDRPPPPGTPPERILKAPRGLEPRPMQAEGNPAASAAAGAKPPQTLLEKDEEFRKRAAQRVADDKKLAQEASNKAAKDENCEAARETVRSVSSGQRMSRVNEQGEKVYLSDEERAHRLESAQKALNACR
jgi:hypothetical protein